MILQCKFFFGSWVSEEIRELGICKLSEFKSKARIQAPSLLTVVAGLSHVGAFVPIVPETKWSVCSL